MGLTDFFIDYVPMYNKFRAVSSILVIAEFTIPLLAMLALKQIVERPELLREKAKAFFVSLGLTGGLSLLFAIAPRVFFPSYVSTMEMNALQNALPAEHLAPVLMNLEEMRVSIFTADAWRSFCVILAGVALLLMYVRGKLKSTALILSLAALCLLDMWTVNKRYLYDAQFVAKGTEMKPFAQPSETDKAILKDTTYYRVLNLSTNTFNENETSYWHKSIGGYHAAKLRRYQELIEAYIQGEMGNLFSELPQTGGDMSALDPDRIRILNMLNAKYFIFPLQGGGTMPVQNPYAMGNAKSSFTSIGCRFDTQHYVQALRAERTDVRNQFASRRYGGVLRDLLSRMAGFCGWRGSSRRQSRLRASCHQRSSREAYRPFAFRAEIGCHYRNHRLLCLGHSARRCHCAGCASPAEARVIFQLATETTEAYGG